MARVQTIVRAEARQKTAWQQAAKDAGLNLNAWMVNALDESALASVDILRGGPPADTSAVPAPAERVEPLPAPEPLAIPPETRVVIDEKHRFDPDQHFKPDFK